MRGPLLLGLAAVALVLTACGKSAAPDLLREGRDIYADTCSVCHGSRGQGGVGPSLESVLVTWPDCDGQVEWISLGSAGWKAERGSTYGAQALPVEGGMPAQGDQLTDREIRLVTAFERVEYGGQARSAALDDCGVEQDAETPGG
jgi:mono/diheme cytochrome c family protein